MLKYVRPEVLYKGQQNLDTMQVNILLSSAHTVGAHALLSGTTQWLFQHVVTHSHTVAVRCVRENAKSDYSFRHVSPSVRMELGSYWTDFHEIWYVSIVQ
jgi:hypothetical protein